MELVEKPPLSPWIGFPEPTGTFSNKKAGPFAVLGDVGQPAEKWVGGLGRKAARPPGLPGYLPYAPAHEIRKRQETSLCALIPPPTPPLGGQFSMDRVKKSQGQIFRDGPTLRTNPSWVFRQKVSRSPGGVVRICDDAGRRHRIIGPHLRVTGASRIAPSADGADGISYNLPSLPILILPGLAPHRKIGTFACRKSPSAALAPY